MNKNIMKLEMIRIKKIEVINGDESRTFALGERGVTDIVNKTNIIKGSNTYDVFHGNEHRYRIQDCSVIVEYEKLKTWYTTIKGCVNEN